MGQGGGEGLTGPSGSIPAWPALRSWPARSPVAAPGTRPRPARNGCTSSSSPPAPQTRHVRQPHNSQVMQLRPRRAAGRQRQALCPATGMHGASARASASASHCGSAAALLVMVSLRLILGSPCSWSRRRRSCTAVCTCTRPAAPIPTQALQSRTANSLRGPAMRTVTILFHRQRRTLAAKEASTLRLRRRSFKRA